MTKTRMNKVTKSRSKKTVEDLKDKIVREIGNMTVGDLRVGKRYFEKKAEMMTSNPDACFTKRQLDEIWEEARKIPAPGFVILHGSKKRPRVFR
jgi:hypothetical protein